MKRLVLACVAVMLCASAQARDPLMAPGFDSRVLAQTPAAELTPVPQRDYTPVPQDASPQPHVVQSVVDDYTLVSHGAGTVELYECVRVHNPRKMDPCSVPTIIEVPDPRICHKGCCVAVEVCLPQCGTPKVCCGPLGQRVTLDYGCYKVQLTSTLGVVHVRYIN